MKFTSGLRLALLALVACRSVENASTTDGGASQPAPLLVVLDKSDATARFIDSQTHELLFTAPTGVGPHEVACRGGWAVVCDYGEQQGGSTLTVLDANTGELVRTIDLGEHRRPHGIVWIDDEQVLVTSETSQALLQVDVRKGAVVRAMKTEQRASHMVALSTQARRAFVANIGSNTVTALDLNTGAIESQIPTGAGPEGLDVTPDGREVWVGNRTGDTLTVIDAQSLTPVATLPCAKFPIRVKITPDGRRALVSCAQSGDVAVFDVATRAELRRIAMQFSASETATSNALGAAFSDGPVPIGILIAPDSSRAFVANTNADLVTELDLKSWTISGRIATGRQPDGLGWSVR